MNTKKLLLWLAILIIILIIFQVGELVGYHRAKFSYQWGENYYKMFDSRRGFMMGGFLGSHGSVGTIIKVEANNIIVADKDKSEKSILVNDDTEIRRFRENIKFADLKIGDFVVVVGAPDEKGQIEARLLRVVPADINKIIATSTSSK